MIGPAVTFSDLASMTKERITSEPRAARKRLRALRRLSAAVLLVLPALAGAAGASLPGTVRETSGRPVAGAMVIASHPGLQRSTAVFSDADGHFALPLLEEATYELRVRRLGYKEIGPIDLYIAGEPAALPLTLQRETDPRELAWQLPASRWLPLLLAELSSDVHREEFLRQCTFCHQQGNWATRVPRSAEDWEKIFKLMARMGGVISSGLRAELPAAFNAAYADESYIEKLAPVLASPPPAPDPAALAAVITEWDLGHPASMQHDLAVHPDGSIYSVDMNQDRLYRLDPRTSERQSWSIPAGDTPLGGVFAPSRSAIAPNSNAHVGPHSLQMAGDGSIWVTLALGNQIGRFDPATQQWEILAQEKGLYPHTLRFDQRGRIWYTLAVSNHVAMLDPRSGERDTIRLPARDWRQELTLRAVPLFLWLRNYVALEEAVAGEGVELPVPYGIDIAPDGGVWFSQHRTHRSRDP
jgi:virginiamycin B lyase